METVATRALKMAALNAVTAAGKMGESVVVALYSNEVEFSAGMLPADFTLITVAGMEEQEDLTFGGAYDTGEGVIEASPGAVLFVASSLVGLPVNVVGWVILNTAKTAVLEAGTLDQPVPINEIGDGVQVNPKLRWGA